MSETKAAATAALVLLMLLSAAFRGWIGRRVPSPWYLDEFVYGTSARSIAANWHLLIARFAGQFYLYPRVIAPAWIADSPGRAYALAKAINVGLMTVAAVPVYLWARRLVGVPLALGTSALVLFLPTGLYSAMLVTENAFFPAFLLALYTLAITIEQPTVFKQLATVATVALACVVRLQGVVLIPILISAIVLMGVLDARADSTPTRFGVKNRIRANAYLVGFVVGIAALYAIYQLGRGHALAGAFGAYAGAVTLGYSVSAVARWVTYHAGTLVLASALLPFSALILVVADVWRRERLSNAAERAFVAVGLPAVIWILLQVGSFASRQAERVDERYMFHVVPVFFLALMVWLARGAYRSRTALIVAIVVPAALVIALPLESLLADPGHSSDTFTLVALERLRSHLGSPNDLTLLLGVAVAAASFVVAFAPRRVLLVVAPPALLCWFVFASTAVGHGLRSSSEGVLAGARIGDDPGWVDQAVGRHTNVAILDTGSAETAAGVPLTLLEMYFWNRSVTRLATVNARDVCCLPQGPATINSTNGHIRAGGNSSYVLTIPDIALAGRAVEHRSGMGLYRVDKNGLRLGTLTTGVYPDGWMAATARYEQFASLAPSVKRIQVSLGRAGWTGKSPPATGEIHLISRGREIASERVPIASAKVKTVSFLTPPTPFRVDVAVTPTFSPVAYGGTDSRQLGAQVTFALFPPDNR